MKKQNFLEKIGNYLIFNGNLNRTGFLIMLVVSELLYNLIYDLAIECDFYVHVSRIYMGVIFCYLFATAIAARLKNLKLNPAIAYFFVFAFWSLRFAILNTYQLSRMSRVELWFMLAIFLFLPLFARDKKVLQLWKE